MDNTMEAESWVDKNGEWRTKKVSIMGVVQSFVSQLKIGQDLTRVSLPAILLYPFSMLEVMASRELSTYEMIENLNDLKTPLERMITIASWMVSTLPMEIWRKKPYNPVLGETHECRVESRNGKGTTYFVAEQVSHHPPVSAVFWCNKEQEISLVENLSFGVTFGGNKLSIITNGGGELKLKKMNETYHIPKKIPDMAVRNLIIGSKKIFWEGKLTIECKESNLICNMDFSKNGNDNVVKATIERQKEVLAVLEGFCGGQLSLIQGKDKKKIFDLDKLERSKLRYLKVNELDAYDSQKIWASVNKYILEDKVVEADEAKKKVEDSQRKHISQLNLNGADPNKPTLPYLSKYFVKVNDMWTPKDILFNSKLMGGNQNVLLSGQFTPMTPTSSTEIH